MAEALELIAAIEPLHARLRGLLRVGERRWDVILDRNQRILLPEVDPMTAVTKAIALDAAQDLFARDIAAVDFRNPRRPVIRLGKGFSVPATSWAASPAPPTTRWTCSQRS